MDLAIASHAEDSLIDQLSFKLPSQSTYARERRLVQVMPTGANTFAPNGNRTMTFNLTTGDGRWLDPSSLRLHFRLRNTAAAGVNNGLMPAGGCHYFFRNYALLYLEQRQNA